jgi:hypothetical protein
MRAADLTGNVLRSGVGLKLLQDGRPVGKHLLDEVIHVELLVRRHRACGGRCVRRAAQSAHEAAQKRRAQRARTLHVDEDILHLVLVEKGDKKTHVSPRAPPGTAAAHTRAQPSPEPPSPTKSQRARTKRKHRCPRGWTAKHTRARADQRRQSQPAALCATAAAPERLARPHASRHARSPLPRTSERAASTARKRIRELCSPRAGGTRERRAEGRACTRARRGGEPTLATLLG